MNAPAKHLLLADALASLTPAEVADVVRSLPPHQLDALLFAAEVEVCERDERHGPGGDRD